MTRVALIGAGALGVQLAHQLRLANIQVVGFYDDLLPVDKLVHDDLKVLGPLSEITSGSMLFSHVLLAIGYKHMDARKRLFESMSAAGIPFHTLVHRTAIIDPTASLATGVVIYPGCIVDRGVRLEANVLLNNGCIISHDTKIGEHSFLAPGVVVSGNVSIGDRNLVGSGTVFRDGMRSTSRCRFGTGSVVVKDALVEGTYFGNPARLQKK